MDEHNECWLKERYDAIPVHKRKDYVFISLKIKHLRKINRVYGRIYCDAFMHCMYEEIKKQLSKEDCAAHLYSGYYNLILKIPFIERDDYSLLAWFSKILGNIYHNVNETYREMAFFGVGLYLLTEEKDDFYVAQYNADICRTQSNERDFLISHLEIYGSSYKEKGLHSLDYRSKFPTALMNGDVKVYLQPKVDLKDGSITHAEALIRWFDKEGKLVPIAEYLPVLEECGLTNKVDCFVFEQACKYIKAWKDRYNKDIHISVNLSKNTFVYPFFLSEFDEIHKKHPCDKGCIELELLESIILNQSERVHEVANAIIEHGYRCSLDDFGSGYSSYNVLATTPLDMIKIDRSLFQDQANRKERKLLEYIIKLAHDIEMKVVAEGIETQGYVDYLCELGCDFIQGFVLYKPMSIPEFEKRFLIEEEKIPLHME